MDDFGNVIELGALSQGAWDAFCRWVEDDKSLRRWDIYRANVATMNERHFGA